MRILKHIFICAFILGYVSQMLAGDFKGGFLAGFCASQMDGDKLSGYHKFGPTGGLFVNRMFNDIWGGQFEIRYNQKGAAYQFSEQSYKARLNYIEIPLLVEYKLNKKFKFEAGFQPSVLIGSKVLFNQFETNPKFSKVDFPLALGGYYVFNDKLQVGIRGSYSTYPVYGNFKNISQFLYKYDVVMFFNNAFNFVLFYNLR
jgi:hypothetical protein